MQSEHCKVKRGGAEDWLANPSDPLVCENGSYNVSQISLKVMLPVAVLKPDKQELK